MKVGFTIYETLRRLLLLGAIVGFIGLVLAPDQAPQELESRSIAGTTESADALALDDTDVRELTPHETPELRTL